MKTKGTITLSDTTKAVICAALGNIIWGFSFLFTKVGLKSVPNPQVMLAHRFILSTLIMLVPIIIGKQKISFKGKKWGPVFILLSLQVSYYIFETYGVLYTNATISGLALAVVPVVTIATGAVVLKERPTLWQILFCTIPVAGVVLITLAGKELGVIKPIGILFLLMTMLCSALYKTVNRKMAGEFSPYERTFMVLAVSAASFGISGMNAVKWDVGAFVAPLSNWKYLGSVLSLSILCSIVANLLVNFALGKMSLFKVSSFGALSTLCTAVAGVIFLKEPFSLSLAFGGILILVGVRLITQKPPEKKNPA